MSWKAEEGPAHGRSPRGRGLVVASGLAGTLPPFPEERDTEGFFLGLEAAHGKIDINESGPSQ